MQMLYALVIIAVPSSGGADIEVVPFAKENECIAAATALQSTFNVPVKAACVRRSQ